MRIFDVVLMFSCSQSSTTPADDVCSRLLKFVVEQKSKDLFQLQFCQTTDFQIFLIFKRARVLQDESTSLLEHTGLCFC